jgi:hypothetical protein
MKRHLRVAFLFSEQVALLCGRLENRPILRNEAQRLGIRLFRRVFSSVSTDGVFFY